MGEILDVLVVGAGPSGVAAALAARRARPDVSILLVDRAGFPRDKVCGDAISPAAVAELQELGVTDAVRPDESLRRYRLRDPSGAELTGTAGVPGYIVPRLQFDARLVAAADRAGIERCHARVTSIAESGGVVRVNDRWAATTVVAADGANSTVRHVLGIPSHPAASVALAVRGYGRSDRPRDELFIQWDGRGELSYVWSFPLADGRLNVGYGVPLRKVVRGRAQLVERLRELLPDVDVDPESVKGHHIPVVLSRPLLTHGRILFVGDAAGVVNPLSGEGIFSALASGRLAGEAAAAAGDPGRMYRSGLRARLARHWRHTRWLSRLVGVVPFPSATIDAGTDGSALLETLMNVFLGDGFLRARDVAGIARIAVRARRSPPGAAPS